MSKNIVIDFDDLHWRQPENCMSILRYIVNQIPYIKILFFTIPRLDGSYIFEDKEFCKELRQYIDKGNVQLALHGYCHSTLEFLTLDTDEIRFRITEGLRIFDHAELPVRRIFKGPHWGISATVIDVLKENNFEMVFSHPDFKFVEEAKPDMKYIYYNWNLADQFQIGLKYTDTPIYAHGHTHNVCNNGITEVANSLIDIIRDQRLTPVYA